MVDVLEFIFRDFETWLGTAILVAVAARIVRVEVNNTHTVETGDDDMEAR